MRAQAGQQALPVGLTEVGEQLTRRELTGGESAGGGVGTGVLPVASRIE